MQTAQFGCVTDKHLEIFDQHFCYWQDAFTADCFSEAKIRIESMGVMLSCDRLLEVGRCCYYSCFDWKCILNHLNDISDFELILVCYYKTLAYIMETMWKANNSMSQELELFGTKLCRSPEFCIHWWLWIAMESTLSSAVHAGLVLFGFCKDVSSW